LKKLSKTTQKRLTTATQKSILFRLQEAKPPFTHTASAVVFRAKIDGAKATQK